MLFHINMKQFNAKWQYYSDNIQYAEMIVINNGVFYTMHPQSYIDILTEYNIFYTAS